jgi:hypothetical protein
MLAITRTMRERVWATANVKLEVVTLDTDTTVHTLYGQQMGGRKSYNPKNKGKKSYQPMLTDATELRHTTLATSRLRLLFVAAKIWRHAGRTGIGYSDHCEEKGVFERLMNRLRKIESRGSGYARVMVPALR